MPNHSASQKYGCCLWIRTTPSQSRVILPKLYSHKWSICYFITFLLHEKELNYHSILWCSLVDSNHSPKDLIYSQAARSDWLSNYMERKMRFELTTFSLATRCSTTELFSHGAGYRNRTDVLNLEGSDNTIIPNQQWCAHLESNQGPVH